MGYPTPPPGWTPPPPRRNTADVTVSVIVTVLTVLIGAAGAVMGLFSLAFLDHCPPATCSVDGAVTTATATVGIAGLAGVSGSVVTIIRLVAHKKAWPFAVGTLAVVLAVFFLGTIAYTAAVS